MSREALMADAIERGEITKARRAGSVAGGMGLDGGDHQIFGGVLGADELEDLRFIAGPFEELGAEGVGHELGLAFLKNSVAEGVGEDGGGGELGAQLLLAAGGDEEEAGTGGEAAEEGIVGGGVAGVEGEEDIQ